MTNRGANESSVSPDKRIQNISKHVKSLKEYQFHVSKMCAMLLLAEVWRGKKKTDQVFMFPRDSVELYKSTKLPGFQVRSQAVCVCVCVCFCLE